MQRGRPRKTDPAEVLEQSMTLFWEKGFEGTSLSDLVAATGMAKPGLYATFGDKETLFAKALRHYVESRGLPLLQQMLESPVPLRTAVRTFLEAIADSALDKRTPGGCFLLNSVIECGNREASPLKDLALDFDARRGKTFDKLFRRARKRGELPAEADAKSLAVFFAAQSPALAVMARAGASRKALGRFIDVVMTAIPDAEKA